MSKLYLGLDVGTQGTKGLVIDTREGSVVARASSSYELLPDLPPGAAEQHPDTWWNAVREVCAALAAQIDTARLGGVGVSGQQHGLVALDADDAVLRPAKLWCDTSTADEAAELSRIYGRHVPVGYTASKLLWLKRHEPERFARLAAVLLPHDWINFRLTGAKTMEAGDASGTGFFDPTSRAFVDAELRAIDARLPGLLPPLLEPGAPAGELSAEAAAELGLPAGVPVAAGGGDNMLSAIGSGATRPGPCVLSLGTSGTVFAYSAMPVVDPEGLIAPFCDSTGGWLPLLCVMNVTGVTEEVHNAVGARTGEEHARLVAAAGEVPAGCNGLTFLPYLQGERVPDLPHASGTLLGVRPGLLRPAWLYRAAIEGTSLNLAWGVERMRALGMEVDSLRLVGGAARNPLWQRVLASLLAVPVTALLEKESAALGAALQAAWTTTRLAGRDAPLDELADGFVRPAGDPVEPRPEDVRRYAEIGKKFRKQVARLHSPAT